VTNDKFLDEINILKNFIQTYCHNKHNSDDILLVDKSLAYRELSYQMEFNLCSDCNRVLDYSIERLYECPYDTKPRCRKCKSPCYDKKEWRGLAKIMIYSSIFLNLSKIKKRFKRIKNVDRKE